MNILFSISIAGVALFVAKIVIFIVGLYFLSFLIQDGLGMTLPRTITGFHRDREITGDKAAVFVRAY